MLNANKMIKNTLKDYLSNCLWVKKKKRLFETLILFLVVETDNVAAVWMESDTRSAR